MKYEPIPVTGAVITWARERAGISIAEAAETFRAIAAWEAEKESPTYPQLENMSEVFKVPVAVFFFPEPPDLPPISESFRTLPEAEFELLPSRIRYLLRKAKAFQISLQELSGENAAKNQIVRDVRFAPNVSARAMAKYVRRYLGITFDEQVSWNDADVALASWRQALQKVGVYTFKDAFRVDGYSGFCLYDPAFPIVYVNNSGAKTRQTFTLFHELAHLLFSTSGVDPISVAYIDRLRNAKARRIEVLCNRFAAEFLLPDSVFEEEMDGKQPTEESAMEIADRFHVSREVVFRKFLDRGLITQVVYEKAARKWAAGTGRDSEGGNYYRTQIAYLGREFIDLAFKRYHQNRIDESELADHLNMKPQHLSTLEEYAFGNPQ
jgi:Zn-dependent peptidase ImmA (M78 family)/transcriptional regulator with XRE-family HTH domain